MSLEDTTVKLSLKDELGFVETIALVELGCELAGIVTSTEIIFPG